LPAEAASGGGSDPARLATGKTNACGLRSGPPCPSGLSFIEPAKRKDFARFARRERMPGPVLQPHVSRVRLKQNSSSTTGSFPLPVRTIFSIFASEYVPGKKHERHAEAFPFVFQPERQGLLLAIGGRQGTVVVVGPVMMIYDEYAVLRSQGTPETCRQVGGDEPRRQEPEVVAEAAFRGCNQFAVIVQQGDCGRGVARKGQGIARGFNHALLVASLCNRLQQITDTAEHVP